MASACALAIFSGKIIFNRAKPERLRTLRLCIFTERGRNGQLHLQRRFLRKRGAAGEALLDASGLNSPSQSLTALPAPSGREPLARPEGFSFLLTL